MPPIAAVREGAVLPEGRFARYRTPWSIALTTLGFAALLYGLFVPGLGTSKVLLALGVGALLIFFGVALFSARIARPLASFVNPIGKWVVVVLSVALLAVLDFPYWALRYGAFSPGRRRQARGRVPLRPRAEPAARRDRRPVMWIRSKVTSWKPDWPLEFPGVIPDRVTTELARDNAQRNPQRTASTASALMIGLALVTLVAVLAAGITPTFRGAVNELWGGADYAITAQNNFSPIPTSAAASGRQGARRQCGGQRANRRREGVREHVLRDRRRSRDRQHLRHQLEERHDAVLAELGENGAFVDNGYAKKHHLQVGSPIDLTFATGGSEAVRRQGDLRPAARRLAVRAGDDLGRDLGSLQREPEEPLLVRQDARRRDRREHAALERQLAPFPNAKSPTKKKFIDNQISGLNSILNILYVLLALSVLVSFVRDRQHARPDRVRADERARDAPRGRDDAAPGAADDPPRERDHGADRRRARASCSASCSAACSSRASTSSSSRSRWRQLDRLRDRSDRRRHRRGDLPGASRVAAERARSAPVRVSSRRGSLPRCSRRTAPPTPRRRRPRAMRGWAVTLERPFSRDQPEAHFTASAIVVDGEGAPAVNCNRLRATARAYARGWSHRVAG